MRRLGKHWDEPPPWIAMGARLLRRASTRDGDFGPHLLEERARDGSRSLAEAFVQSFPVSVGLETQALNPL